MSTDVAPLTESEALDRASKFFRVMRKEGATWDRFQRAINSVNARRNLAHYLEIGCPKVDGNGILDTTPTAQDLATLILGQDLLTVDEVATASGLLYLGDQLEAFETTAFPSIEQIAWCKGNGFILLPNPPAPMSLLEVRDLNRQMFRTPEGGWYTDHPFAQNDKTGAGGWLAVRKDVYPNSLNVKWKDQQKLVIAPEYIPNAAEMAWALTIYAKIRTIRLLPNLYARTSSVDSDGSHVIVGYFFAKGLVVHNLWDDYRSDDLGVASARKL